MQLYRKGISTSVIAAVVVVVVIIVAVAFYAATSMGGHNSTTSSLSTNNSTTDLPPTSSSSASTIESSGTLTGAGSTLVYPLMSEWTFAYTQVQPKIQVSYDSIGSGAGIAQITAQTVNFGASDAPLSAAQYAALPASVVTIPESISAVVPAYNIPGLSIPTSTSSSSTSTSSASTSSNGLKFTGAVLARIFLGNITNWDDPAIAALNPGVTLPNHAITVVHRSDGSGTMYAFTNYLSDSSAQWAKQVGYATSVNWPTGLGCKGNEGVAGCIENTPYSIGPLEIAYAIENPTLISVGVVANAAGNYIKANDTTVAAAVQAGASSGLPAGDAVWTKVSIINSIYNDTAAKNAYPITTFTYMIVYQKQSNQQTGTDLVNFLWWVVNDAQQAGVNLGYIPLPANVVSLDNAAIMSITHNGTPLYTGS